MKLFEKVFVLNIQCHYCLYNWQSSEDLTLVFFLCGCGKQDSLLKFAKLSLYLPAIGTEQTEQTNNRSSVD